MPRRPSHAMSLSLNRTDQPASTERSRVPTWGFRIAAILLFAILTAQLWRLQIVDGRAYVGRSAANYLRTAVISPQRGVIYDRNRNIIASNAPVFVVTMTPADIPRGRQEEVVIRLANELRIPPSEIQRVLDRRKARNDFTPFTAVPVRYNVERDAIMRIAERSVEMPGVQIVVESARRYSDGPLVSHILGYMGPIGPEDLEEMRAQGYSPDDKVGSAGIEYVYEKDLRGSPGKRLYQVEVTGQEVAEIRREPARSGMNLALTIDMELQRNVAQILKEGLRNSAMGAAVVMDPRTGDVLAMVSLPTFDNNVIGDDTREDELLAMLKDEKNLPMFPRAFGGQYAPGSVFKLVTGTAALAEGVATRDTVIDSKGVMYVERDEFPDVRDPLRDNAAWGPQNFLQGLANSSNIYFFWLGGGYSEGGRTIFRGLGADALARYARQFGYGKATGLDVTGEKPGIVPDPTWKLANKNERWYRGDTYNMSIGQGDVLVTPLQVANATNAIANGGTVYTPRLGYAELDADGNVVRLLPNASRPLGVDSRDLTLMREAMEAAFEGPHLKDFLIPGLRAAGKTGTAEFPGPLDEKENLPSHGWFTAFAPANDPQVSVTVFVERGSGSADASPIGARILRRYFNIPEAPPPTPTPSTQPNPAAPSTAPATTANAQRP